MTEPGRLVLGVDPGASAALALVADVGPGERPRLLGAWSVYGDGETWWGRLDDGVRGALTIAPTRCPMRAYVEIPGGRGASRRELGPDTWLGLGRRIGAIEASLRTHGIIAVETIGSDEWPRLAGVRVGKDRAGWHRIDEAGLLLDGASAMPCLPDASASEDKRAVTRAEAALIAFGGLVRWRGEEATARAGALARRPARTSQGRGHEPRER